MGRLLALETILGVVITLAAPTAFATADFDTESVFSVVYSATQRRALVGYTDTSGNVAKFADCQTTNTEPGSTLKLENVSDCKEIPATNFLYTSENVARINSAFPQVFEDTFVQIYREDAARIGRDEIGAFGLVTLAGLGTTVGAFNFTKNSVQAKQMRLAFKGAVGGAASAGLTVASAFATYVLAKNAVGQASVPSLESQMIESYQSAFSKSEKPVVVPLTDASFVDGFGLVREAIIRSISTLTEA